MSPKLTKEQAAARKALIDAGIAQVGIQKLEYMGEPVAHKSWKKAMEAKRLANKSKDQTDQGKGSGSKGAKHLAKEKG